MKVLIIFLKEEIWCFREPEVLNHTPRILTGVFVGVGWIGMLLNVAFVSLSFFDELMTINVNLSGFTLIDGRKK